MEELKKAIATSKATTEILEHIQDQIRWATERIKTDEEALKEMAKELDPSDYAYQNRLNEIESENLHIQALKEIANKVKK